MNPGKSETGVPQTCGRACLLQWQQRLEAQEVQVEGVRQIVGGRREA